MDKLILAVSVPLMLMNGFGGIAAFIWLVILGDYWFLIGAGFIALLFSSFGLGLLMLPSTAIQFAGIKLIEKKQNVIGYIFMYLGNLLLLAAFSVWILYVYNFGLVNVQEMHICFLSCFGATELLLVQFSGWRVKKDKVEVELRGLISCLFLFQ